MHAELLLPDNRQGIFSTGPFSHNDYDVRLFQFMLVDSMNRMKVQQLQRQREMERLRQEMQ